MANNGPSKINLEDFIAYFEQHHEIPDPDDQPFVLDYKTERITGAPSVQIFNESKFEFVCVITTKRLLKHAIDGKTMHADSTYKLHWMGYPVHVFGTTDFNKRFHLIAIGFSTRENADTFKFCFQTIKDGVKEMFDHDLEWNALMSDAAMAIKNAFEDIWPYTLKLTCWFHAEESMRKKNMQTARNKIPIMKDLKMLHLSPNVQIFDIAPQPNFLLRNGVKMVKSISQIISRSICANKYDFHCMHLPRCILQH